MAAEGGALTPTSRGGARATAIVAAACACSHSFFDHAALPASRQVFTVPLVEPLTAPRAFALAELRAGNRTAAMLLVVDTGGVRSALPRSVIERLGLDISEAPQIRMRGVSQARRSWRGAVVPRVLLGDLELANAPFWVVDEERDTGVLGYEVLAQRPVRIDRDRGVLVIGAPPMTRPDPGDVVIESRDKAIVEAEIDGERVLLELDTGADSMLDIDTAREMGLREVSFPGARQVRGLTGSYVVTGAFEAERLRVGLHARAGCRMAPLPAFQEGGLFNRKVVGLLGMNFLTHYVVRLDAGAMRVRLEKRRDPLEGVAERVGRWPWAPRCADAPGCVRAEIRPSGALARVRVEALADYSRPTRFLLAVPADRNGATAPPMITVIARDGLRAGAAIEVGISVARAPGAAPLASVSAGPLALVDVNPIVNPPRGGGRRGNFALHPPASECTE